MRSSELRREKAALELRILDLEASLAQATAPAPGPAPTPVPCPGLPELEALSLRASAAEEQSSRVESELASTRAQARALEQVHAHLREEHGRTADALSRSLEELESVRCSLQVLSCRGPGEARAEGAAEEYRALYAEALAGRSSLECLLGSLGALMRGLEAREEELRGAEEQLEQAMDLVAASSARYAHALSETARQRALAESAQERQAALALEVAHIRAALDRALADRAALGDAQAVARGLREEAAGLRVRLATAEDLNGALRAKLREAAQDSAELDSASDRTAALLEALEHQRVAFEALGAELAAERELSSALITERERLSGALAKERAACDQAAGALLTAEGAIDLLRDELERARAEAGATPDRSRARIEALKHENNRMARAMDVLGERARRAEGAREAREGAAAETVAFLQAELEGMAASERVLRAELAQVRTSVAWIALPCLLGRASLTSSSSFLLTYSRESLPFSLPHPPLGLGPPAGARRPPGPRARGGRRGAGAGERGRAGGLGPPERVRPPALQARLPRGPLPRGDGRTLPGRGGGRVPAGAAGLHGRAPGGDGAGA